MARTKKAASAKRRAEDDDFIEDDAPVKKSRKPATPKAKKPATPRAKKATTPKAKSEKLTAEDFEPSKVNLNENLTEPLLALGKEEMDLGNKFKGISIRKAAMMLEKYPETIRSGADALKLKGIGKSIAKKIDDILASGAIQRSDDDDENQTKLANIEALSQVYGITRTLAATLVREHDVSGVVDLVGKHDLLDAPARIGLKYYKEFQEPIPPAEVEAVVDAIRSQAEQLGDDVVVHEHGQYARHESPIDEIHVVVGADDKALFAALLDALQQAGLITDMIASADALVKAVCFAPSSPQPPAEAKPAAPAPARVFAIPKFSQLKHDAAAAPDLFAQRSADQPSPAPADASAKAGGEASTPRHRRLELRYSSKQAMPITFTNLLGPPAFVEQLQAAAQAKGLTLAAKTLREQSKLVAVGSEHELFDKLGVAFVPYEERAAAQI